MADIPKVRSRNMVSLIQSVISTHQRISDSIHAHAQEVEAVRHARNQEMNANARLAPGHKKSP